MSFGHGFSSPRNALLPRDCPNTGNWPAANSAFAFSWGRCCGLQLEEIPLGLDQAGDALLAQGEHAFELRLAEGVFFPRALELHKVAAVGHDQVGGLPRTLRNRRPAAGWRLNHPAPRTFLLSPNDRVAGRSALTSRIKAKRDLNPKNEVARADRTKSAGRESHSSGQRPRHIVASDLLISSGDEGGMRE